MSEQEDLPYYKKIINEITEADSNLLVIGKIVSKKNDLEFIVSDDTGDIEVVLSNSHQSVPSLKDNAIVKVLGTYSSESKNITVDFIEELVDFNFDLYKKVYKLKKSIKY